MKRLIAVSDSHGMTSNLRDAVGIAMRCGPIDAFVFLGDGVQDFEKIRPVLLKCNPAMRLVGVRGNNDFASSLPAMEAFVFGGRNIIATHGHHYQVKYGLERLCYAAREREAEVALFGHTHQSLIEEACGVLLVNPGAVCEGGMRRPAYAELAVDEQGRLKANLIGWAGVAM